jgi:hypothetical protein
MIKSGMLRYYITIKSGEHIRTFPAGIQGAPTDWDFPVTNLWETFVVDANAPSVLYDVTRDRGRILSSQTWNGPKYSFDFVPGMDTDKLAIRVEVTSFSESNDVSWQRPFGKDIESRLKNLSRFNTLCLRVRAGEKATDSFGVALVEKDGTAWGTSAPLTAEWKEIRIPLSELSFTKKTKLPRGRPAVNPYWLPAPVVRGGKDDRLNIENIQAIQFSIGTRFLKTHVEGPHAVELEGARLEAGR